MGRRDLTRRRSTHKPAKTFLLPVPRAAALSLVALLDAGGLERARALIASTPVDEAPDLLLALAFQCVTFFGGWVDAHKLADDPAYEGLTGGPLRQQILLELLEAAASGSDEIGSVA